MDTVNGKPAVSAATKGGGSEVQRVGRRTERFALIFALSMMAAAVVLPFVYSRKELTGWLTIAQLACWAVFSGLWLYIGQLVERDGAGINGASWEPARARASRDWRVTALFLLLFCPSCFAYIFVTFVNTGYLGFNYVLMFIVAGFSTYFFTLPFILMFLLLEVAAWVLIGHLMWGGWMRIDDVVTSLAGFLFASMMFYLLDIERVSRRRAEALSRELDAANDKLRAYSAQVEDLAATQERNRIAREIHDTLGHSLTVVNVQLETARALIDKDAARAVGFLEKAQNMTKKGLADVRTSVASLRASPLDGRSLEQGLRALAEASRAAGFDVEYRQSGEARPLSAPVESALYRAAQEGLTNARKHSQARRIELSLGYGESGRVTLTVSDDGVGCESATGGFGITGVRERIQLLDGEVAVRTSPGEGLELRISVSA